MRSTGLLLTSLTVLLLLPGCPASPAPPPRRAVAPQARRAPPRRPPRKRARPAAPRRRAPAVRQLASLSVGRGAVRQLRASSTSLVVRTDHHLRAWSLPKLQPTWSMKAPSTLADVALSADGRWLLLTLRSGTNLIYDAQALPPTLFRRWKRKTGRGQALSADGRILVRGDVRKSVRGYELQSYKMKWLAKADRLVMSRDGKVVTLYRGAKATHVDALTGRPVAAPSPEGAPLAALLARIPGLKPAPLALRVGPRTVAVANHAAGKVLVYRVTP